MKDASAGSTKVEVLDFEWHDSTRDRPVPVRLFMPTQTSRAPLVVFSHGLGGSRSSYSHLGRYWASHGVATLHPQHLGSDRAVWTGGGAAMLGSLRAAGTPENAIARVNDVRFVIDHLFRQGGWADRLDPSRIGVAGHSFGANTALLACGARYRESGGRVASFGDTRIRAAVVMSAPSLPSDQDPAFAYSSIGVPTLHLTGTHDSTPIPGLWTMPEERRVPFDS
ncbi:MAG TPA: alpha/beta hydrolase fold domain-containing protein, partial [Burkholderiaceae bacterium]|nr:alpha/beta hydrolase fold domain-containing protein [Burkholderiaceae bacterium]